MLLGEALAERAAVSRNIASLRERIASTAITAEGEQPAENPELLLQEAQMAALRLSELVANINRTNAQTPFNDDGMTITDAMALRDGFATRIATLELASKSAHGGKSGMRYYRTGDLRQVIHLDVSDVQAQLELLTENLRNLDARMQRLNWTTEIIER